MLKIKDNVDIKELEKFGFIEKRKYIRKENLAIEKQTKNILIQATNYCPYGDKKLLNNKNGLMIYVDDTLYDLIESGLVEKAEE